MDTEIKIRVGEAYVSGALTAPPDGARTRLFYELLAEVVESAGLRAYLPHLPLVQLVVDEAHCISTWGHDFRPDFLDIARLLPQGPDGARLPVHALTAWRASCHVRSPAHTTPLVVKITSWRETAAGQPGGTGRPAGGTRDPRAVRRPRGRAGCRSR